MSDVRTQADQDVEEDYAEVPVIPRWRPIVALALSLVGFGISMYLTIDHFQGIVPICSSKGFVNCELVTTSKYSYILGIPVSLLGLLFFTAMVGINWPPLWRARSPWVARARLALAVSGVCFVLYLLAAELFSIKAICLWCTGVHITTFLLFVLVMASFPLMSGRAGQYQEWDEDLDEA
ncbi:MAG TPA: vitamin K epoxide reductase family protein [Acidimicrobiales bacterium]|nr:vitamin K epoxide reductase family protein [Acidimicrobiales bacterium]HLN43581.1 vitamin K epoxide reductase family protein [Acidimicrobiales bacterium]